MIMIIIIPRPFVHFAFFTFFLFLRIPSIRIFMACVYATMYKNKNDERGEGVNENKYVLLWYTQFSVDH